MKVGIIGTVGVPASYGGFETLVDQLIQHKRADIEYTVYCSGKAYADRLDSYRGAKLKYINLQANGMQSIPYDILSLLQASRANDVVLVLGVSGCAFLPAYRLFSNKKLVINVDGLEHRRDKWGKWVRKFLKFSEHMAVKHGDEIISDNKGITDYLKEEYGKDSSLIAYGGDHVLSNISDENCDKILQKYGLTKTGYSLGICRIEPENNVHTILEAFSKVPTEKLTFIGNWKKSEYGVSLKEKYSKFPNIKLLDAVYNLDDLYALRDNCKYYLHGHSAGGTNPSLVEAMFFGKPIIAYDCVYNRETTENKAIYFSSAEQLEGILQSGIADAKAIGDAMKEIADRRYKWEIIARQYEDLY